MTSSGTRQACGADIHAGRAAIDIKIKTTARKTNKKTVFGKEKGHLSEA